MAAFYNTATLSYRDTSTNSNTVEGQLVQVLACLLYTSPSPRD